MKANLVAWIFWLTSVLLTATGTVRGDANTNLSLSIQIPSQPIMAGQPVRVNLALTNVSGEDQRVQKVTAGFYFYVSRDREHYEEFQPWALRGLPPPSFSSLRPGETWNAEMWLVYDFRHKTNEVAYAFEDPGRYWLRAEFASGSTVRSAPLEVNIVPASGREKAAIDELKDSNLRRFLQTGYFVEGSESQVVAKCRQFLSVHPDSAHAPLVRLRIREKGIKEVE